MKTFGIEKNLNYSDKYSYYLKKKMELAVRFDHQSLAMNSFKKWCMYQIRNDCLVTSVRKAHTSSIAI